MKTKSLKICLLFSSILFFNLLFAENSIGDDQIGKKIEQNESDLKMLREERNFYENLIEPEIWLLKVPLVHIPIPLAVPRDQIIKAITINYYKELIHNGKKFDKNELVKRIKYVRDISNRIKLELKNEISLLQSKIKKLEDENYKLANSRKITNDKLLNSRKTTNDKGELICTDDAWRNDWKVIKNNSIYLDQTKGKKGLATNPGWKESPERIGDANPPPVKSAMGIRYMHPITRDEPAVQARTVDLTDINRLRIMTSGNCKSDSTAVKGGDFLLTVKVGGKPLGSETVKCGWREVGFDLSGFRGEQNIEIEVHANGWSYEYAYFDCIVLE